MNKQQIIAPLVAMAIFALGAGVIFTRNQSRSFLHMRAQIVGRELVTTTNSASISSMGQGLRVQLEQLLASPATVDSVELGDEPMPIGDGRASVRVFLKKQDGVRLAIRLQLDPDSRAFRVLGFWRPARSSR